LREADQEWLKFAARVGYDSVVGTIADQPEPLRRWCWANWDNVIRPMIVDAITRQAIVSLVQRDCNAARERGELQ
jgi:hypothetical protein